MENKKKLQEEELIKKREELKQKYGDKEVLVINNNLFLGFNTFVKVSPDNIYNFLFNKVGIFMPRYIAELNFDYRQVIPYCLIKCEDNYFITHRLEGDDRLVDKYSLGIGGHIEKIDGVTGDYIYSGMEREINEEIDIKSYILNKRLIGLIVSDKTEVDKVHVGMIYVIEVNDFNVTVKETETLEGNWISKEDLLNFNKELESWSRIAVDEFIRKDEFLR